MLILNEQQVQQCLHLRECLEVNREAFIALAQGQATVPSRIGLPYHSASTSGSTPDWTLFKPAATSDMMGCKIVSVRRNNPAKGLPLVPATILHLDAETGSVDAVLDGTYLTAARTAAGSALATALAWQGREMQHLVVFGAGLQAELHIQMIAEALPQRHLSQLTIVNRTLERAVILSNKIQSMSAEGQMAFDKITHCQILALDDTTQIAQALSTASCIVTCTNTATPLFDGNIVLPAGCHLNSIGSYTSDMQEIPTETTIRHCRVWMDTPEARTVGDLKDLPSEHPVTLFGKVLQQDYEPAKTLLPCTFFKSVGTAIQDVMTASIVVKKARELGIGTEIEMN
ncbi:ornithine cyclodeaminase [Fistulifera solaris]|uniref:Ornithine cyclodeaminase n=1 Tax=Fistulifera solaris TaxID=1519565 RepID=A0A1Z5JI20_FISSO|nr:ornithine cyclodeaminase [Fistulifera solaris]|eukprot:GAX13655.1 ornithine cyclodeaminase [Fistulifera solaris]